MYFIAFWLFDCVTGFCTFILTSFFLKFTDFRQLQTPNTRTKYHKILTTNTKAPHNPTLRITNWFIEFKYQLGHCKTNYDWFCTRVYMTVARSQCVFHYTWRALQTSFREGCKFVDGVSIMPNPLRWHHDGRDLACQKPPASRLLTQPFIQTQIKQNVKAPRHWPLCWEFTGDR